MEAVIDTPVTSPLLNPQNPAGMIQALMDLLSTDGGVQGLPGTFLSHLEGIQQALEAGQGPQAPDPGLSDEGQAAIVALLAVLNADQGLPPGGKPLPVTQPEGARPRLQGLPSAVLQRVLTASSRDMGPAPETAPQGGDPELGSALLEPLMGKESGGLPRAVEAGAALRQLLAQWAAPDAAVQPDTEVQPTTVHNPTPGAVDARGPALSAPRALAIDLPLQAPNWDQALGQRVVWMLAQDTQRAELRLNPPQLGPVEIQITVEGDKTQLSFHAQNAMVKEALDAALPRLREMIADTGLNLVDVHVTEHGSPRGQGENPSRGGGAPASAPDTAPSEEEVAEDLPGPRSTVMRAQGLVDDYA
jgi:flagellar hook-length control protein FliK